jgi:hypothetical protein
VSLSCLYRVSIVSASVRCPLCASLGPTAELRA